MEEGEPLRRQRQQVPPFRFLEEFADLLLRRAVDALVRHLRFPVQQKLVLFGQTREDAPLQGIRFTYFTPLSILPLCRGV